MKPSMIRGYGNRSIEDINRTRNSKPRIDYYSFFEFRPDGFETDGFAVIYTRFSPSSWEAVSRESSFSILELVMGKLFPGFIDGDESFFFCLFERNEIDRGDSTRVC